jgi:hypothetical protein
MKLYNNAMGSDIQSLVLGTNAFSPIGSIMGQIPAEEEQAEGRLFHPDHLSAPNDSPAISTSNSVIQILE